MSIGWPTYPREDIEYWEHEAKCQGCDTTEGDFWCLVGDPQEVYCEDCGYALSAIIHEKAQQFALDNCRITKPIPPFDSALAYSCTPEDYENGMKECYTLNGHRAHCRHNCTNYDELLKDLTKNDPEDDLYYVAISVRIEELIEKELTIIDSPEGGEDL